MKTVISFFAICFLSVLTRAADTSFSDASLTKIIFDTKLGNQVPASLSFRDETGARVSLDNYFHQKPVILILGYYGCPMLCTVVVNGVMENLRGLQGDASRNYDLIFVSIDPAETPGLAAEKKKNYARSYGGRPEAWHFLTGDESSIRPLADAIGFRYAYDPAVKQFAHPGGFVVLTPAGKVSRYFLGVTFSAAELNDALHYAGADKISSDSSKLDLLCFHYAPLTGKYAHLVLTVVRAGGLLTIIALGGFIFMRRNHGNPGRPG